MEISQLATRAGIQIVRLKKGVETESNYAVELANLLKNAKKQNNYDTLILCKAYQLIVYCDNWFVSDILNEVIKIGVCIEEFLEDNTKDTELINHYCTALMRYR